MKKDLSEIQNYLEYLYRSIDDETEKVEISVDVFQDLREVFNSAILLLFENSKFQRNISLAMLISLAIIFLLVFIFIFKI